MILLKLILGTLVGYIAHQMNSRFERWQAAGTPKGWIRMARYTLGASIVLPVYLLIRRDIFRDNGEISTDVTSYITAYFSVAVGVVLGYLNDDLHS